MLQQLLKGRLFGHPIHPMLVHFPTALFSAGFLFDIGGLLLADSSLFSASLYSIILGLLAGLPAALAGFIDYVKLGGKPKVFRTASWHAGIQFVVLMTFGIIAGVKFQSYPDVAEPGILLIGCSGLALAVMLVGNYLGGELVFTHKVGIDDMN